MRGHDSPQDVFLPIVMFQVVDPRGADSSVCQRAESGACLNDSLFTSDSPRRPHMTPGVEIKTEKRNNSKIDLLQGNKVNMKHESASRR